jgi:AraC family transcriptional regulator
MRALAFEADDDQTEHRTSIQDLGKSINNIKVVDTSCCAQFELLDLTGTAVPPPQRWSTPGFNVELYRLPPFALEDHRGFTAFFIYFGPVVRRIAINSDDFQSDRLQAGDIEFLPAGTMTKAIATETAPFVVIMMAPERVAQLTDALFGNRPGHLQPRLKIRMPNARLLYRLLREYLLEPSERGTVYLEALLTVLATEVFRRVWSYADLVPSARHSLAPAIRRRMIEYIAANLTADLSLTRLAAVACLSPYHFARCFRQEFGKPPHRYVLDQRLEFARRLLADTNLPMAAVAARCGFASQGRLATAFRTRFGIGGCHLVMGDSI